MRSSCKWMAGIVLAAVGGLVQAAENPVGPGVPRYQVYAPPESLSGNTGEPSIGYNTFTKKAFVLSGLRTLWATFPQDQTPKMPLACDAQYVDRSFVTTGITTLDPIGITDSLIRGKETRRTWIGQLAGKAHITAYTDDDGMTWTQTEGNAPVVTGFDHQGIGVGPYPTTGIGASIPHPTYANAFYYCGQDIAYANCTRSDDGGLTFKPPTYMYTLAQCGGLHGHPRVGPDGTVYVPNPSCGGDTGVAVSTDAGTTWAVRTIPNTNTSGWDPQAAIGTDNTLYMCFADGLNAAFMSVSKDKGVTWSTPKRLGTEFGLEHVAFPQAVAGTVGRASCAYLGTTTRGSPTSLDFKGVWHLYFSTTYDGGQTFTTVNATPDDIVQGQGGIWDGGGGNYNRNLLDFNEMTIDENGYPLYGYADGCLGSCNSNPSRNSFSASPRIARQIAGKPLYADRDPADDLYAPPESCLAGTRNAQESQLSWRAPENGGAAISGYRIYRSDQPGADVLIGETGPEPRYRDLTVDPNVSKYYYRVTALNSEGEGLASNEVMLPLAPTTSESTCTVPGITIATNASGDGRVANTDLLALSIAEPQDDDGNIQLRLKVGSLNPVPPGTMYTIRFHRPGQSPTSPNDTFIGMVLDDAPTPSFVYGNVSVTVVVLASVQQYTVTGDLPAGSSFTPDGTITFKVPRSLFNLQAGDVLSNFLINTHVGAASRGSHVARSNNIIDASSGVVNYTLRNAGLCLANTEPQAVLAASTNKGGAPLTVEFDGAASSDAEDAIVEYYYDFGDGTRPVTETTNRIVTHEYAEPGLYRAQLVVKDARGLSSVTVAQQLIEVVEAVEQAVTPFTFIERTGVRPSTFVTSELVRLLGFEGSLPISVSEGMQYSINGGPFTASAGMAPAGATLAVRHVSAAGENSANQGTVTVGNYTAFFRSITSAFDRVPDAFDFGSLTNQAPGTQVESAVLTLANFDEAAIVAGSGLSYRVNTGSWTSARGTLKRGDTLQVRHLSNASSLGYTKSSITVGGVKGSFTTRTRK